MDRDPLTGLRSRREFLMCGEARASEGEEFVLAVANVDHFKRFNIHNGHFAGDDVLRTIAKLLSGLAAFRIGGDSFAVLLAEEREAEGLRQRVAAEVNPPQPAHCGDKHCMGIAPAPRISIGVSRWRGGTFAELLRRAEGALERAKRDGRDRVEIAGAND